MSKFTDSGDSRETSAEIMTAIESIASNEADAIRIWETPVMEEALAIWEIVTNNGLTSERDHCWGAFGGNWASELGVTE